MGNWIGQNVTRGDSLEKDTLIFVFSFCQLFHVSMYTITNIAVLYQFRIDQNVEYFLL